MRWAGVRVCGRGGWLTFWKRAGPLAVVLQLRSVGSRRGGRARDGAKCRGGGPIVSEGTTSGRGGANGGLRSPDAQPRPARAVGIGRGGLRHFSVLPDPLAVCSWGVAKSRRKCARDGKGATIGSGAQHGSVAHPWTARPPKRPAGV